MNEYDFRQADKEMSRRVDEIYGDPKRHTFYSCFQADEDIDRVGPRGGKSRGRKTICVHCGTKRKGHAENTEQL